MIFSSALIRQIQAGKKTQTRRPLQRAPRSEFITKRDGTTKRRPQHATVIVDGETYRACRYKEKRLYKIKPGRTKQSVTTIEITSRPRIQRVGDIDQAAAVAEGFATVEQFKAYWVGLHERALTLGVYIDTNPCLAGRTDPITCVPPDFEALVERFDRVHADTLVWVITFAHEPSPRRLLASAFEHDDEGRAYTRQEGRALYDTAETHDSSGTAVADCSCALCLPRKGRLARVPEPEPVDEGTLLQFAADAEARWAGQPGQREEQLKRTARSLANRLRQSAVTADRAGVDPFTHLEEIERHIELLERQRGAA